MCTIRSRKYFVTEIALEHFPKFKSFSICPFRKIKIRFKALIPKFSSPKMLIMGERPYNIS